MRYKVRLLCGMLAIVLFTLSNVNAAASLYRDEEVQLSFQSTDQTTLDGSLLIPPVPGPHPVVILIHGAGWHDREGLRAEAEFFATAGIAAFIYDKRTVGYSPDGIGEDSRSYALLADDVHAAVNALRLREDIDQEKIGLWGLSEGASVAALAASQNSNVSFVITVGASGVMPAQQTSWAMENRYRHLGFTSTSFLHTMTRTGMRFLVSMGLFAEALYDHVPPLEKMQQPILAIWGSKDRITPPAENYAIMRSALERGGNEFVTFQFIPDANHDLRASPDGFIESEYHAAGYVEAMMTWIADVLEDKGSGVAVIGEIPQQDYYSFSGIEDSSWFHSVWLHLGWMASLFILFSSFYATVLIHLLRKRQIRPSRNRLLRLAGATSSSGMISVIGFFGYYGYLMMTQEPGPLLLGNPLPWLVLQILSIITIALTLMLGVSTFKARAAMNRFGILQAGLPLMGGVLFIPWSLYWKLPFLFV